MKISKKLWLWIFEFKLKRVPNNEKIEFLTKQLLKELENQGYSIYDGNIGNLTIWNHYSDKSLVLNSRGDYREYYEIPCGTYEGKFMKK